MLQRVDSRDSANGISDHDINIRTSIEGSGSSRSQPDEPYEYDLEDPNQKKKYHSRNTISIMSMSSPPFLKRLTAFFDRWRGSRDFFKAQGCVLVVLFVAYAGNNFPRAYPRNDNHSMPMFWLMNALLAVAALATLKHDANSSSRGVQLLSRNQTEEWKGWMQWAFILVRFKYRQQHTYRSFSVANRPSAC